MRRIISALLCIPFMLSIARADTTLNKIVFGTGLEVTAGRVTLSTTPDIGTATGTSLVTTGVIRSSNNSVESYGGSAGLSFQARDLAQLWQWYANGGVANLWNGSSNSLSVDLTGKLSVAGIAGTTTNDSAAAGSVGETAISAVLGGSGTATITIASPGVVTWTAHGTYCATAINFTTTGALPTGIVAGTTYYITCGASFLTNSFQLSTTIANAIAGTSLNTSGTQSGVHTVINSAVMTSAVINDLAGVQLTAGQWSCSGLVIAKPAASTTTSSAFGWITNASATLPNEATTNSVSRMDATAAANVITYMPIAPSILKLASTTTIYLSSQQVFAVSTMTNLGRIECVRQR